MIQAAADIGRGAKEEGSRWSRGPAKEPSATAIAPVAFPNQAPEPTPPGGVAHLKR